MNSTYLRKNIFTATTCIFLRINGCRVTLVLVIFALTGGATSFTIGQLLNPETLHHTSFSAFRLVHVTVHVSDISCFAVHVTWFVVHVTWFVDAGKMFSRI